MTETFPFWIHPVRDGVYQIDCKDAGSFNKPKVRYSLFKRGAWHMSSYCPYMAAASTLQTLMLITGWRGISKES